jgi:3-isopropylmalate/(R)-2-methylmalate dehydratase large subunit
VTVVASARTLVEKILLAHCDADDIRPGDVVTVRCDLVMANDVSGPVAFRAMEKMGAERVLDPSRSSWSPTTSCPRRTSSRPSCRRA